MQLRSSSSTDLITRGVITLASLSAATQIAQAAVNSNFDTRIPQTNQETFQAAAFTDNRQSLEALFNSQFESFYNSAKKNYQDIDQRYKLGDLSEIKFTEKLERFKERWKESLSSTYEAHMLHKQLLELNAFIQTLEDIKVFTNLLPETKQWLAKKSGPRHALVVKSLERVEDALTGGNLDQFQSRLSAYLFEARTMNTARAGVLLAGVGILLSICSSCRLDKNKVHSEITKARNEQVGMQLAELEFLDNMLEQARPSLRTTLSKGFDILSYLATEKNSRLAAKIFSKYKSILTWTTVGLAVAGTGVGWVLFPASSLGNLPAVLGIVALIMVRTSSLEEHGKVIAEKFRTVKSTQ